MTIAFHESGTPGANCGLSRWPGISTTRLGLLLVLAVGCGKGVKTLTHEEVAEVQKVVQAERQALEALLPELQRIDEAMTKVTASAGGGATSGNNAMARYQAEMAKLQAQSVALSAERTIRDQIGPSINRAARALYAAGLGDKEALKVPRLKLNDVPRGIRDIEKSRRAHLEGHITDIFGGAAPSLKDLLNGKPSPQKKVEPSERLKQLRTTIAGAIALIDDIGTRANELGR